MLTLSDKPIQFQVYENTIYVLTENGKLYKFYENYERIFPLLDVDKVEVRKQGKNGTDTRQKRRLLSKLTSLIRPYLNQTRLLKNKSSNLN